MLWALIGAIVGFLVVLVVSFKLAWRVAEPNEALIISGFRASDRPEGVGESMSFRIVTGKGTLVMPGITKVRKLSLDAHESEVILQCVTNQKIPIVLKGVVVYKVGDDYKSIANAARRFLDSTADELETKVKNVFVGHLRAIAGTLSVEEMITDQDKFAEGVRAQSGLEMETFGLVIDSFQIQEIADRVGYIDALSAPRNAEVQREARISRAVAERESVEREQEAETLKAAAVRTTEVQKAAYQAEMDRASREAQQQGPLAEASALQAVVEQRTRVAQLEAKQKEQQLQIEVTKPAEAEASKTRTAATAARDARISNAEAEAREIELRATAAASRIKIEAQAQAEATRLVGEAEADKRRAIGLAEASATEAKARAEAAGIRARADALAHNQEAVIAQQLAERFPEIVAAASNAFSNVGSFTVLNGTEGVTGAIGQIIQSAGALLPMARTALQGVQPATNGRGHAEEDSGVVVATPPQDTPGSESGSAT